MREPKRKIINPDKFREIKKTVSSTNDWSNIPYYPTTREKRENVAKYLISMGKKVPPELIRQIETDKIKDLEKDSIVPNIPIQQNIPIPPNKFSPQYAQYIGHKPRAQASTRIKLGGVY